MRVLFLSLFLVFFLAVNSSAQTNLAEQYFKKGDEFAKSQEYEKAIKFYTSSLKIVENNKELKSKILYNIGSCFYQQEKFEDAEKAFTEAIKLSKDKYIQAIYSLGLTQIELGKSNSAEATFRKVIRLNEKHSEAWFDLGMVLLERKKYENAKIAFQKSIEYKTTRFAEAQNNLGVISALQGKIAIAETQFYKAFLQSNQTLLLAWDNYEFCKLYQKSNSRVLLANIHFTKVNKNYG